jgi:Type IV secretory system Conjugative DNA transfer
MEEKQHQIKFFGFLQLLIYLIIIVNIYFVCIYIPGNSKVVYRLMVSIVKLHILHEVMANHIVVFILVLFVAFGTRAMKNIEYNLKKHFVFPFFIGLLLFMTSLYCTGIEGLPGILCYGLSYIVGTVLLHTSLSNLSKILGIGLKKDVWNEEEQSFQQNTELVKGEYLLNIPMEFYYKKKWRPGWININVFRAMMVIGVPGSGKTESIIIPYIKQLLAKGYSMLVYDFKYPDLAEITYYHYLKNKQHNGPLANHRFHVVNIDQIEYSQRVNPILPRYIETLSDAAETAEAIVLALKKSGSSGSGADQFFTQSAINLLAATIYFFAKEQNGKYCTLPHVLAFLNLPYGNIFQSLFPMQEIQSLLSPFKSAFENKAFDQLEGQIGTLKINLSRLVTKETFWIFSGNDIDLKISNPPSVLVLANSDRTQNTNSAFYASILMRVMRQINQKGNNPSAIVVDETPTLFLHKIENLIATARSNKVAVVLGLQEITQFYLGYSKEIAQTITSIMGTVMSGSVRSKETLDWLEKMFGKNKQLSQGVSIDRNKTNYSLNEKMDSVIPASRIANLNAGEMVGIVSRENQEGTVKYQPNLFNCKIKLDFDQIKEEKKHYLKTPVFYQFGSNTEKHDFLMENMQKIIFEVESLIK